MAEAHSLPDLKTRITVDTTGLKAAEAQAKLSGANIGSGLGAAGTGAKAAEKDVAALEKRMGAAGLSTGKWTSLLGGGAGLTPALLGAGAAVAVLAIAGKSIVDISDKWETAQRGLAQATGAYGLSIDQARQNVDKFLLSNRAYVKDQSEVVDAYAALTRQGLSQKKTMDDLNLALDLSKLKHIDLTSAVTLLQQAEMGRGRALIPLGIQMKDYPVLIESQHQADVKLEKAEKAVEKATIAHTAALKAHGPHSAQATASAKTLADATTTLAEAHNYAKDRAAASADVHDLLHKKLDGGRQSTSDLEQAQNKLGNTWQTLAHVAGPPLLSVLTAGLGMISGWVDQIGQLVGAIQNLIGWIGKIHLPDLSGVLTTPGTSYPSRPAGFRGRASGGPVLPNSIYTVGERGPETLVMGNRGGMVIPNGGGPGGPGGTTVNVTVMGSVATERQLVMAIREGIRRADMAQR